MGDIVDRKCIKIPYQPIFPYLLRGDKRSRVVEADSVPSPTLRTGWQCAMVEAVASPGVEIFGIHELVLNANNKSGYKDVYPVSRNTRSARGRPRCGTLRGSLT